MNRRSVFFVTAALLAAQGCREPRYHYHEVPETQMSVQAPSSGTASNGGLHASWGGGTKVLVGHEHDVPLGHPRMPPIGSVVHEHGSHGSHSSHGAHGVPAHSVGAPAHSPTVHHPMHASERHVVDQGSRDSLLLEKFGPREVVLNEPFDYEIHVTNLSSQAVESVTVHDHVPVHMSINHSQPPAASRRHEDGVVTWLLGTLEAHRKQVIRVNATARRSGVLTHGARVDHNTRSVISADVLSPALRLVKEAPEAATQGESFVLRYRLSNVGQGSAEEVRIGEVLPQGMSTEAGERQVDVLVGSLPAGKTQEFVVHCKASRPGALGSFALATARGNLRTESNWTQTFVRAPVLSLTPSAPEKAHTGRAVTVTWSVRNNGTGEAENVMLHGEIPDDMEFVGSSLPVEWVAGEARWPMGRMVSGESRQLQLELRPLEDGEYRLPFSVEADGTVPAASTALLHSGGIAALQFELRDLKDPLVLGDRTGYEIVVTNQGDAAAHDVELRCDFEPVLRFLSCDGVTKGVSRKNQVRFAALPVLAPGETATWSVTLEALEVGDSRFRCVLDSRELGRPVVETESTYLYD